MTSFLNDDCKFANYWYTLKVTPTLLSIIVNKTRMKRFHFINY